LDFEGAMEGYAQGIVIEEVAKCLCILSSHFINECRMEKCRSKKLGGVDDLEKKATG